MGGRCPPLMIGTFFVFSTCKSSISLHFLFAIFCMHSHFQYGKPAHEQGPSSRGFFSLCITIYRRKNHKKATMVSMKVHVSSLHAPIYRNFYLCIGKINALRSWELSSPDSFGGSAREDLFVHRLSRVARHRNVQIHLFFQRTDRNFYKLVHGDFSGERTHVPS